jgi:hypothetical protein
MSHPNGPFDQANGQCPAWRPPHDRAAPWDWTRPRVHPDTARQPAYLSGMAYHLRHLRTGDLIRTYEAESAALAFVRDVVRFGSRENAAQFALDYEDEHGRSSRIAEGRLLVTRALEDRAK